MLQDLPLHPAIVHLPVGLAAALPLVALLVAVGLWRDRLPRRAWAVVVLMQALVLGGGLAAQRTGQGDEDRVEARVGDALVHEHEERAEAFLWTSGVVLVLAILVLLVPAGTATRALVALTLVGTLAGAGLAFVTGHAGGLIVHGPHGLVATAGGAPLPASAGERGGAHEDDDDD